MIQANQKYYNRSYSTVKLLASPTHLIFQLIKFTTLPYMICQIINNNNNNKNKNKTEINIPNHNNNNINNIRSFSTLALSKQKTELENNQFKSPLESTKLFHQLIRQFDTHHQLINLLDQFLNLTHPPKLNPKTVQHIFAIIRPTLLDRLNQQHQTLIVQPQITTSKAWESEAMNQIVQMWYNQSRQTNSSIEKIPQDSYHLPQPIRALQKIQTRRRAFTLHGPSRCDCQRPLLPPRNLSLDQVGSLNQSTLAQFTQKLDRSINLLTYLRIIDLMRLAERWDLAVIFLDRTRTDLISNQKNHLSSRRLGQVTALLEFLRGHGRIEPEIDPLKMWSVHFVCESIERSLKDQPHEWARINRLSLDVLTQFSSMPIGFDRRTISHQKSEARKHAFNEQHWPCLNFKRHERLLDSLAQSTSELEFAVLTRERCQRLLSKLTRLICQPTLIQNPNIHCWSRKSVIQLRLLEHLARQGTNQQFMSLLDTHLTQHPTSPKLAKLILVAAKRFKCLSENPELITQALSKCHRGDLRPIIDFILRPRQSLETLNHNLNTCLESLPAEKDARIKMYSHLIYRLSQLPTPSLALRVWDKFNREERSRKLLKVGRRTRVKLKKLIKLNGEGITTPVDKLPNQLIRSMVYVYKNLTRSSSRNNRNEFAIGKNYQSLYKRLSLKTKSNRLRKWPITKQLARSHLIFNLIKSELDQVEDYKILKSLENSLLSSPVNDHHNSFENLMRFLLFNKIKGSELHLIKRFDRLQQQVQSDQNPSSLVDGNLKESVSKVKAGRRRKQASNSYRGRHSRLKYFQFVRDWIRSRGGFTITKNDYNQEEKEKILIRSSKKFTRVNPFNSSYNRPTHLNQKSPLIPHIHSHAHASLPDHYHPHPPPPRRRSCSRYWARIVTDHSSPPAP